MNTIDDFLVLLQDDLGLPVARADVGTGLDQIPGWDSVHLLSLLTTLERATGRPLPLADALAADSLEDIYRLAVGS
ncbi:acyl carrier protein [Streptomyces sp. NPDC050504]|uniref:acyl carrier protein n=1 Tax=Streptomyces sp. NPDC050504 TaxID=3365618 RepID=UPI003798A64E